MNAQLPTLEPGVTFLADEDAPGALYPIVGRHSPAPTVRHWVDARNVAALYAEDDVPEHEAAVLFEATLELLAGVADAVDAPVVVTAGACLDRIRDAGPGYEPALYAAVRNDRTRYLDWLADELALDRGSYN